MITRKQKPGLLAYFRYGFGADPQDIWEFVIDGEEFRLINGWRSGMKLYRGDELIAENKRAGHLNSKKPMIQTEVSGKKIAIYVRAILSVSVRVSVDSTFISEKFI